MPPQMPAPTRAPRSICTVPCRRRDAEVSHLCRGAESLHTLGGTQLERAGSGGTLAYRHFGCSLRSSTVLGFSQKWTSLSTRPDPSGIFFKMERSPSSL